MQSADQFYAAGDVAQQGGVARAVAAGLASTGCDVIDLSSLSPIDFETILDSVAQTGRLVIVHEAARNVGLGAEIAATVAERGLYDLHAPIRRITGYDVITPYFKLEHDHLPSLARITDGIRATVRE